MQETHLKILDKHAPQPPGKSENTRIATGNLAFLIAIDCQTVSEPYPKRIPTLSKLAPNIQTLSKLYSNAIQILSKAYPNSIQTLTKPYQNPIRTLSKPYLNCVQIQSLSKP